MKHGEIMSKVDVLDLLDNIHVAIRYRRTPNGDEEWMDVRLFHTPFSREVILTYGIAQALLIII